MRCDSNHLVNVHAHTDIWQTQWKTKSTGNYTMILMGKKEQLYRNKKERTKGYNVAIFPTPITYCIHNGKCYIPAFQS